MRFLIIVLVSSGALARAQDKEPSARVTITVIDGYGHSLPRGKISIQNADGASVFSGEADVPLTISLPYGKYKVLFDAIYSGLLRRELIVDRGAVLLSIVTAYQIFDTPHPVGVTLRTSRGTSCTSNGVLSIKLIGLFLDYSQVRTVQQAGELGMALFEPLEMGTYLAVVIDGDVVRATKIVDTFGPLTMAAIPFSCEPHDGQVDHSLAHGEAP